MSNTLENRLRGIYEVGYNAEFGHRDFSKHVPAINIEAADEIANLKNERDLWIDRAEQLWSMYDRDAPTPDNSVTWFDDMGAAK